VWLRGAIRAGPTSHASTETEEGMLRHSSFISQYTNIIQDIFPAPSGTTGQRLMLTRQEVFGPYLSPDAGRTQPPNDTVYLEIDTLRKVARRALACMHLSPAVQQHQVLFYLRRVEPTDTKIVAADGIPFSRRMGGWEIPPS
jgi:hypothetical protein